MRCFSSNTQYPAITTCLAGSIFLVGVSLTAISAALAGLSRRPPQWLPPLLSRASAWGPGIGIGSATAFSSITILFIKKICHPPTLPNSKASTDKKYSGGSASQTTKNSNLANTDQPSLTPTSNNGKKENPTDTTIVNANNIIASDPSSSNPIQTDEEGKNHFSPIPISPLPSSQPLPIYPQISEPLIGDILNYLNLGPALKSLSSSIYQTINSSPSLELPNKYTPVSRTKSLSRPPRSYRLEWLPHQAYIRIHVIDPAKLSQGGFKRIKICNTFTFYQDDDTSTKVYKQKTVFSRSYGQQPERHPRARCLRVQRIERGHAMHMMISKKCPGARIAALPITVVKRDANRLEMIQQRYDLALDGLNNPDKQIYIALELAASLLQLHQEGIIHGDLKTDNILVKDDLGYLTDFDISGELGDARASRQQHWDRYSYERSVMTPFTDVYSFAVMLARLIIPNRPYRKLREGAPDARKEYNKLLEELKAMDLSECSYEYRRKLAIFFLATEVFRQSTLFERYCNTHVDLVNGFKVVIRGKNDDLFVYSAIGADGRPALAPKEDTPQELYRRITCWTTLTKGFEEEHNEPLISMQDFIDILGNWNWN